MPLDSGPLAASGPERGAVPPEPAPPCCAGLLRRRTFLLPTLRGWLVLGAVAAALALAAVRHAYQFLAENEPAPGDALVVEGWLADYALGEALAEFRRGGYRGLFITGGPIDRGTLLSEYKTYPELSAATLIRLGGDPAMIHPVPADAVRQDRTYASACALGSWMRTNHFPAPRVTVFSLGAHARRTRLMFQRALGPEVRVAIVALEDRDFDPAHWWRSSAGVRAVVDELVAYTYARLLFDPPRAAP